MKYLHTFLERIYNVANLALSILFQFRPFEEILKESLSMLTHESMTEIKSFVKSQQDKSGAFINKVGAPDIYYTLFGFFIASSLSLHDTLSSLKKYTSQLAQSNLHTDIDYYCALILTTHFYPKTKKLKTIQTKTFHIIQQSIQKKDNYGLFLGFLGLVYSKQYVKLFNFLLKYQKTIKNNATSNTPPVTVLSTDIILYRTMKKKIKPLLIQLREFYTQNGGFKALKNSPVEDLLSTSVALFALKYCKTDISIIKPTALNFITGLFCEGGFKATVYDTNPDIEYTFYGLLALSSLHKN